MRRQFLAGPYIRREIYSHADESNNLSPPCKSNHISHSNAVMDTVVGDTILREHDMIVIPVTAEVLIAVVAALVSHQLLCRVVCATIGHFPSQGVRLFGGCIAVDIPREVHARRERAVLVGTGLPYLR
jgi:hypothetical protein